jgi:hypothetical protein
VRILCLGSVGALTSHNTIGLHGLLRGKLQIPYVNTVIVILFSLSHSLNHKRTLILLSIEVLVSTLLHAFVHDSTIFAECTGTDCK